MSEPTIKQTNAEKLLSDLRAAQVALRPVEGATIEIDNPAEAILVIEGHVDLFIAPDKNAGSAAWAYGGRIEPGGFIPGIAPHDESVLIARPMPQSEIFSLNIEEVEHSEELALSLDAVLEVVGEALEHYAAPRVFTPVTATETTIDDSGVARSVTAVRWLTKVDGEATLHRWKKSTPVDPIEWLSGSDWLEAEPGTVVYTASSHELGEKLLPAVQRELFRWVDALVAMRQEAEKLKGQQAKQRAEADVELEHNAELRLARVLGDPSGEREQEESDDPAFAAVSLVADLLEIKIKSARVADKERGIEPVSAVIRASNIRERTVRLEEGWYHKDVGPLVGFLKNGQPVALMRSGRGYVIEDPVAKTRTPVDDKSYKVLNFEARMLYAPLPETKVNGFELLRFGAKGLSTNVWILALCGVIVAGLSLATPILTGRILGTFVPRAAQSEITQWSIILLAVAFVAAAFSVIQNLAALRFEGLVDLKAQAGLWDRLLALPASFFRRHSTAELSAASLGVNGIRDLMSGMAGQSVLAFVAGLAYAGLMLYYDPVLGLVAIAVAAVSVCVSVALGFKNVRVQREVVTSTYKVSSSTFQLMSGMAKLRVAAAEERAFSYWSVEFARLRVLSLRARTLQNRLAVFNSGFVIFAPAAIFAYIGLFRSGEFPVATFLTFNVAAFSFLIATLRLTTTAMTLLIGVPMFEKLTPILDAAPEVLSDKTDPGEITGAIEVKNLAFAYEADTPPVLNGVSFTAKAGDFVALVGSSGCGKSTLLRMMLGFEKADQGGVYYDGQDLADLDAGAVRHQCGVVLQQGQLFAGDILSNIVGTSAYTVDDAWAAAEMAGLKEDIEHMPMGMNTVLSEGASTISGGQRQRLMIARALISRPRIVFFDEATSALDNRTQKIVTEAMDTLHATRIVIAHRLSTIREADQIVVLDQGRVVQNGPYEKLIAEEGLFKSLASRQIA